MEVEIIGTGSYVPDKIVTNDELALIVETNDEWISSRTGIKKRRIVENENTSDLAYKAALKAIENSNVLVEDIDLIIVATTSPDCFTPSTACIVQGKLGAINAVCFDMTAACTGFIYALNTAAQFIKSGQSKKALVIGAEVLSKIVNWEDRNTCVLFGDGAGAAILTESNKKGIDIVKLGSDGSKAELLKCEAAELKNPYSSENPTYKNKIEMDGKEIFKFAGKIIPCVVNEILDKASLSIEDIKYIVPHQANYRIIEYACKKLKVDMDKFYVNLHKYGNTSAASIAIALDEMNNERLLSKGDKIILVGFGGGLTFGGILINW